ncbi:MAG: putative Ig domain-containing protein [Undibacterium sp.]|nr:putative Ig domain-containing protein [Opitutaceae bacterium]
MKSSTLLLSGLVAFATLFGSSARADNMASIAITPATGVVTLAPRWPTGGSLAGFHFMAQDLSLGGGATQFYSVKGTGIPAGGDVAAFTRYIAASGAATTHADIGSKLTPNSYSALTSADPDVGYGAVNFYLIHRKNSGDYFSVIKPSSGTASAVTDLKPMSGPGGPATLGGSGYFGLTFAASNLGYGLNYFYYLRSDPVTGNTKFGTLDPALLGTSADKFDLGISGYNALAFTGSDVGYGTDKMYYLRLDPITGFTILGTLHPLTGRASDIANLGSVFSALTYVPGDVGFGSSQFYTTGSVNTTWQSVSFAAIADRAIAAGSFTVAPSASSTLPIVLTVVSGSTGAASISGPVGGVYTVNPTAPGVITLQATQAGRVTAVAYEYNMLRQSFTATGVATLQITTQPSPSPQTVVTGNTATFTVAATGTTALTYQWRKAGANITGNASATTAALSLANAQVADAASYDVVVTNASGSIISNAATLTVNAPAPVVTNNPLTAAGTVASAFSFTITASGTPTSYSASPLPAGLSIAGSTISGTPTTAGTTSVVLGATNATGTGNATLTITVAAAGVVPIITNSPLTAAGTVGISSFRVMITASGTPTSYSATPLPPGLNLDTVGGAITGTPSAVGTTTVLLGATNATGTGNATLTITVAAAGVVPIITNSPLTAGGTVASAFSFTITASGTPTSYSASPLPAGLSIAGGTISGTPTAVGTTTVLLGATNATGTGNATFTITVSAAGAAPIIANSVLVAAGTVGAPFSFTITASGTPTSYSAAPLPAGLTLNSTTGTITGTPVAAGTTVVVLGATNATGTATATLTLTTAAANVAPIITSPTTASGTVGAPFVTYLIAATGLPTSYTATGLPAGLTLNPLTGAINGSPTTAGTSVVTLTATNSAGVSNATLTITVAPAAVAPVITSPTNATAGVGTPFPTYLIAATGLPTSYAATGLPAGLSLDPLTGAINGTPTVSGTFNVTITASNATGISTVTLVIVVAPAPSSRIVNFSARAISGPGSQTLIMGFVVAGDGKNLLVRGIGPTLAAFGISNALVDPMLTLFNSSGVIASNDDWQTDSAGQSQSALITATSAQVGAFALPAGSKDSALIFTVNNGALTTGLLRPNGTTGVALTEIYDIDTVPGSKLVNVSARMNVTAGEGTLIAGLVIAGNAPKTVLIRGVGPTLSVFGVTGVLADPQITIFSGATVMASNDNWETGSATSAQLVTAASQVGAFALPAGSKDAALLVTLQPGAYTVQVSGVAATAGVALIEVYEMP